MIPGSRWSSGRIALKVWVATRAGLDSGLSDGKFSVGVSDADANVPRRAASVMTSMAPEISGAMVSMRTWPREACQRRSRVPIVGGSRYSGGCTPRRLWLRKGLPGECRGDEPAPYRHSWRTIPPPRWHLPNDRERCRFDRESGNRRGEISGDPMGGKEFVQPRQFRLRRAHDVKTGPTMDMNVDEAGHEVAPSNSTTDVLAGTSCAEREESRVMRPSSTKSSGS